MFDATGIILAGGRNSRMNGVDKAQLVVDSLPLIERKIELLQGLFAEVLIVCNRRRQYDYSQVKIVFDQQEGCGPLMGLYSGLKASSREINFVTACDMPFVNEQLVRLLIETSQNCGVAAPVVNGYWEPMMAAYNKSILPVIQKCLDDNRRKMVSFFDQVQVREITEAQVKTFDPELLSFFNVNTPEQLEQAKEIIAAESR
jgi:molybdopterin-guanine dinucleotide biosynthesis protein A